MNGDQWRSFNAGKQGRTPPLFDPNFDKNAYNQGRAARAMDTPWLKPETSSARPASHPASLGEYAKALGVLLLIAGFFYLMKWGRDMDAKKAEQEQFAAITPQPVEVATPAWTLKAEPLSNDYAKCIGTCPATNLGAATSIKEQGSKQGWTRLIAQFPNGYMTGWIQSYVVRQPRIPPRPPLDRSKFSQPISTPEPEISSETEHPPTRQPEVPQPPSSTVFEFDPNKPLPQVKHRIPK